MAAWTSARTWAVAVLVGAVLGAVVVWLVMRGAGGDAVAEPPVTPTPAATTDAPSATPAPTPSPTPEPTYEPVAGVPEALWGTWCTRSGDSWGGGSGEPCFSFAQLLAEHPATVVEQLDRELVGTAPGALAFEACLDADQGPTACSMAALMYVELYPPGVGWDCLAAAAEFGLPGCDPDFTSAHDVTETRLVIPANHQQGDLYYDMEPMYRQ